MKAKNDSKRKAVPKILPREPLTKKAAKGIETYAVARCRGLTIYNLLIKYALEAERMRRDDLYGWLEGHGWRWHSGPVAYWHREGDGR